LRILIFTHSGTIECAWMLASFRALIVLGGANLGG